MGTPGEITLDKKISRYCLFNGQRQGGGHCQPRFVFYFILRIWRLFSTTHLLPSFLLFPNNILCYSFSIRTDCTYYALLLYIWPQSFVYPVYSILEAVLRIIICIILSSYHIILESCKYATCSGPGGGGGDKRTIYVREARVAGHVPGAAGFLYRD